MLGFDTLKQRYNEFYNVIETRVLDTPVKRIPARIGTGIGAAYIVYKTAGLATSVAMTLKDAGISGYTVSKACWDLGSHCFENVTRSEAGRHLQAKAIESIPYLKEALFVGVAAGSTCWLVKKTLPIFWDVKDALAKPKVDPAEKKLV